MLAAMRAQKALTERAIANYEAQQEEDEEQAEQERMLEAMRAQKALTERAIQNYESYQTPKGTNNAENATFTQ